MKPPRIAIPVPTSFDLEYNRRNLPEYIQAIEAAGGIAVEIALSLDQTSAANLINSCVAVCLPGNPADVNPQKYGQEADPSTACTDHPRENIDELLIQDAHNLYKPIFGICFGAQIVNVWRGGTLVQDLTVLPVNHSAGASVAVAHSVQVAAGSTLGGIVDQAETHFDAVQAETLRLPVNSSHHQAIGIPGDGLRIVARCPQDGVIEAVEGGQQSAQHSTGPAQPHFVLCVQWHPERSVGSSATSQALFKRFVAEAATWQPRLVRTSVA